jgi:hypothetical protein
MLYGVECFADFDAMSPKLFAWPLVVFCAGGAQPGTIGRSEENALVIITKPAAATPSQARPLPAGSTIIIMPDENATANPAPAPSKPGVYKATPYTMLVYVPGPLDQQMVFEPGERNGTALTIRPPLRLIPRK